MKRRDFKCPRCGSNKFGTSVTPEEECERNIAIDASTDLTKVQKFGTGHCHGILAQSDGALQPCKFQWSRSKDIEVMTGEERDIPEAVGARLVRPIGRN
jgi:hypothetical protein